MKKFFAAFLAISITAALAGCNKPADEQLIDDITEEISVVTETVETVSETETETSAETVSETEETSAESVSETENTESETSAVTDNETNSQNNITAAFPVGKWTENRAYIYDFKEDGTVVINTGYYDVNGTYTYENNVLTLKLLNSCNVTETFSFDITEDKDGYKMDYKPVENGYGFCDPYEPAGLMSGYYSASWGDDPFYLKKGNLRQEADIDDLKGVWIESDDKKHIFIFDDKKSYRCFNLFGDVGECSVKNGNLEYKENDEIYVFNYYNGNLYMSNRFLPKPIVLERTESEPLSIKDFDNRWYFAAVGYETSLKGKGNGGITGEDYDISIEISLNNDTVTLTVDGEKKIYTDYFVHSEASEYYDGVIYKYVYLFNENDIVSFEIIIDAEKE